MDERNENYKKKNKNKKQYNSRKLMFLNKTADKLVFNFLTSIKNGYLEITTYEGEALKFGNPDHFLKANIKIKNPPRFEL